jgi:outer membrane protein assembly factor BamD (BamD/ComL family)
MSDDYGISTGISSVSDSLEATRTAGKKLTKTIENIQHDGIEVAQQELEAMQRKKDYEEGIQNSMIYKAIAEYSKQNAIIKAENKAEKEFIAKYGKKEWDKVIELKNIVEKEHQEKSKYYGHKLDDVRRVQFWCFFLAFIITSLLFYFRLV